MSDGPLEKEVEHACDKLMQMLGWSIVRFSQPRNSMQTRGIPDRRYYPPKIAAYGEAEFYAFWMEVKRAGGKQSAHQKAFQEMCKYASEDYVLGGVDELLQYLNSKGISKASRVA